MVTVNANATLPGQSGEADPAGAGYSIDGLHYARDGKAILTDISFDVAPGQILGIIGPNGAGKSTLIKLLAGEIRPDRGSINFLEKPLSQWRGRLFSREVAYLPQTLPASDSYSVRELVTLGRYPWHGPLRRLSREDREAVTRALEETDSMRHADRLVSTLSGGERQRVWIAMVLAQARRFLLLDEPTSALDLAHQARTLELLRQIAHQRGMGVVLIVHDLNLAARYCDRLMALRDGRLVAVSTPHDVMSAETLTQVYDIPIEVFQHPVDGRPVGYIA
ncbi:heme ABC transporter ATP-binding protein [Roseibium litorale]|uniref:Heme ABC transporter ATP-binding protein n=1 Tax=Roseibium litorale TaxID=2803841 RepID=A0ABR9CS20_9HYPH|nr:heme ABC transporter ATP-binding protein [Roseibium litorale]MBD8893644.1 heme ABC transporter ATP-binding protein [Roseibium litorale]